MSYKKTYIKYDDAIDLISNYVLPVVTKLDYQISYKDIHIDLPSDPQKVYKDQWTDWSNFLRATE